MRNTWDSESTSPTITTVAGNGTAGYLGDNASPTTAELNTPMGVALDAAGNVFIADTWNNVIRKVSADGSNITTIAGTGTAGYSGDGGAAGAAQLSSPRGIVVDSSGNIIFADAGNQRIREISAGTGTITTIAGTGTAGYSGDNGAATNAELNWPRGVALDTTGDIFFTDTANSVVREIDASGTITTVAGNGTYGFGGDGGSATNAELSWPRSIAVDDSGNIYIADTMNNVIREVVGGTITTFAGDATAGYSGDGASAADAELNWPTGLALDGQGNLLIADQTNNAIRKIDLSSGLISTVAGTGNLGYSGDGGPGIAATLNGPSSVAIGSPGELLFTDQFNNVIRKVTGYVSGAPAATNVALGVSSSAAICGQPVTFTATISCSVGLVGDQGTVQFAVDGTDFASPVNVSGGQASISGTGLSLGTHTITATYSGGISYLDSSSTASTLTILEVALSSSENPSQLESDVTLTASLPADATGTVTFMDGTAVLGTAAVTAGPTAIQCVGQGYVALPDSALMIGTNSRSVSVWFKTDVSAGWQTVFCQGANNYNGGRLELGVGAPGICLEYENGIEQNLSTSYADGFWHHAVLTFNGSSLGLYVDGESVVLTHDGYFPESGINTDSGNGRIGSAWASNYGLFSGEVAEPFIFNRVLTGSEVTGLYAGGPAARWNLQEASWGGNLVAGYYFDEGSGSVAADMSGHNRNGTVIGNIQWLTDDVPATAALTISGLTCGTHNFTAVYRADSNYDEITSDALTQTVNPDATTTLLTTSPNTCTYGDEVTLQATVINGETGTVTFKDGTTVLGTATVTASPSGIQCDGQGYVALPDSALVNGANPRSVSMWFKTDLANQTLFCQGENDYNGARLQLCIVNCHLWAEFENGCEQALDISCNDGAWHHAALTFDGGSIALYLDGISQTLTHDGYVPDSSINTEPGNGRVGSPWASYYGLFGGTLADPMIFDDVLTGSEVAGLYAAGPGAHWNLQNEGWASDLVAGYYFDEHSGTTVADMSGHHRNGTVVGTIQWLSGSGVAELQTQALLGGTNSITADYSGDGNFAPSTSLPLLETVTPAATASTLSVSTSSLDCATSVTFTASVAAIATCAGPAAPSGSVAFYDASTLLGTAVLNNGQAELSVSSFLPGQHEIMAVYEGDTNFLGCNSLLNSNAIITTRAGTGSWGNSSDGTPATAAQFGSVTDVVADAAGNLFIADADNGVVREVDHATGLVRTVVGSDAGLSSSLSIAVAPNGDLYIADTWNNMVRKWNHLNGDLTIFAGTGDGDYTGDGGSAANATFWCPTGVAVDEAGDVYIVDNGNNVIREVDALTGEIATVAGNSNWGYDDDCLATAASLAGPSSVVVAANGDLFIADSCNNVIRRVHDHQITTIAGNGNCGYSGDYGLAVDAELNYPMGMALDGLDDLFIADNGNCVVREVNLNSGVITTIAGNGTPAYDGDNGAAVSASLAWPSGVTIDASGNLLIADTGNCSIREVMSTPTVVNMISGPTTIHVAEGDTVVLSNVFGNGSLVKTGGGTLILSGSGSYTGGT
jgi:large repetitive protein